MAIITLIAFYYKFCLESKVCHPHMSEFEDRHSSFDRWKEKDKFNIEEWAKIGFFYDDDVGSFKCFQCGEGLINDDVDDYSIYEDHMLYNIHCPSLKEYKGKEYFDQTQSKLIGNYFRLSLNNTHQYFLK